jgi:hypothetical protein
LYWRNMFQTGKRQRSWPPVDPPVVTSLSSGELSNGLASFDPAVLARESAGARTLTQLKGSLSKVPPRSEAGRRKRGATFLEAPEPLPFNAAALIDPDGRSVLHHQRFTSATSMYLNAPLGAVPDSKLATFARALGGSPLA